MAEQNPSNVSTVGPNTPAELVKAAYERLAAGATVARERLGRPLTFAEKVLFGHADDPATIGLGRGTEYGDYRPDRVAMQDATAQMALLQFMLGEHAEHRGAHHGALRPPHPGARRRRGGPRSRARREPRGLRLPAQRLGEVRHRLLEAGQRHHPPGRAGELRVPRRHDDRHRLAHAERRRARHGRDRCGRCRRGRRDGGLAVQHARPEAHRRAAHRIAVGLDRAEGRHSQGRGSPHGEGRHRRDRRVLRAGRRIDQRHRQGHDLQHGRRDRRHLFAVPLRPAQRAVPQGHTPRGDRRPRRPVRRVAAQRRRGRGRSRALLRPRDRDRPFRAAAAPRRAPHSRPRPADLGDGRGREAGELPDRDQLGARRFVHELVVRGHRPRGAHRRARRRPAACA